MRKGGKWVCDKCGRSRGESGAEIITEPLDGVEGSEVIDLCARCWKAFKKFVGVKK